MGIRPPASFKNANYSLAGDNEMVQPQLQLEDNDTKQERRIWEVYNDRISLFGHFRKDFIDPQKQWANKDDKNPLAQEVFGADSF